MELSTFQFARPFALLLLVAVPYVLVAMWLYRRRTPRLRFPSSHLAEGLKPTLWTRLRWLPPLLRVLAVALAVLGLARPQVRAQRTEDVTVEGIDIVIALDVSTSMRAVDFKPRNRLHVAKQVIADFIRKRVNDRIGLVVFAGEAYTQAPLTLDYNVLLDVLKSVRMGVIEDGTAIGNALATSLNRLKKSKAKSKVVILVTDGDNNSGNISPTEAAAIAKQMGVKVYTIMVGKGGKVPYPVDGLFGKRYQYVEMPVNPALLKQIAKTTGGEFYVATDRESLERNFQSILDELEKTKLMEGGTYVRYTEVFPLAILPAVLLLFLELLLSATRLKTFP
ncbi:MAG: VWA domain-containing protein [Deltaproteobacteria bacterium]|nr:MAG: VWA domain-containing protein [Deltaproteobacteria bacterium]